MVVSPHAPTSPLTLAGLPAGRVARVAGFADGAPGFEMRLREVGFAEGDAVEVLHHAPFGDAVSVRLNRTIIALRREEAAALLVAADDPGAAFPAAAE